jgi:hypothetical protein
LHGKDAMTQEDIGVDESSEQKGQSTMGKVKEALHLGK